MYHSAEVKFRALLPLKSIMTYRFITLCVVGWVGLCATAGVVVEYLWS